MNAWFIEWSNSNQLEKCLKTKKKRYVNDPRGKTVFNFKRNKFILEKC